MSQVMFFIAAIAALAGAIGVVTVRNPFYAVLALVCHLVALAALFLLLQAEFVAAAQVVVYAGAVMVLYVFVVAYVGGGEEVVAGSALRVLGPLFAVALAIELLIAMLGTALRGIGGRGTPFMLGFGTPKHIGQLFLTTYLLPFEVASLLLLVAAIGALVLARRRRGLEDDDPAWEQLRQAPRPVYTGTMAEGAGVRSVIAALEEASRVGVHVEQPLPGDEEDDPFDADAAPAGAGASAPAGAGSAPAGATGEAGTEGER